MGDKGKRDKGKREQEKGPAQPKGKTKIETGKEE